MAEVYRATDLEAEHAVVAVKMIGGSDHRLANKVFDSEYRSLDRLRHPNVVRLLDGGRDEKTDRHFLVFEWIEGDLKKRVEEGDTPEGWDDFVQELGLPLFSALAAAHEASVAHRDIKPANSLIDDAGAPKLADFGIAKIITDIAPGYTVANFGSVPFAAPAAEGLNRHTAGDVYSLGVTALAVLTRLDPLKTRYHDEPHQFVVDAMEVLDAPSEASEFLARCTSKALEGRPLNAAIALTELKALADRREVEAKKLGFAATPTCFLSISAGARKSLVIDFDLESGADVEELLLSDLQGGLSIAPRMKSGPSGPTPEDGRFVLLGDELRCQVAMMSGEPRLVVTSARRETNFYLERDRARSWQGVLKFSFGRPPDGVQAEVELSELIAEVLVAVDGRPRGGPRSADDEVFTLWRASLQALNEVERGREAPIRYKGFRVVGGHVQFGLEEDMAAQDLVGQQRIAELVDGSLLAGQVSRLQPGTLTFRVEQGDPGELPQAGTLKVDLRLSQASLRRQEMALEALRSGAVARPDLKQLLATPAISTPPEQIPEPRWVQPGLDAPKRAAVEAGIGSSDILLVEGPPGTGKTTLITELVAQELARDPDARILISSQTHSALDNVLERLDGLKLEHTPRILRIGRPGDERIAEGVEPLLVGPQLKEWREEVITGGRAFLRKWAAERSISVRDVEVAMRIDELASVLEGTSSTRADLGETEGRLAQLRDTRRSGGDTSNETVGEVQDRIAGLKGELAHLEALRSGLLERLGELDSGAQEELGSLCPDELRDRAGESFDRSHPDYQRCSQLVRLLGDWHARFGRGPEFEAAALVRSQIVAGTCVGLASVHGWEETEFDLCIVDEASKANATEILIPMSRGRRWILVGDHRQLPPHIDEAMLDNQLLSRFELTEDDLRETLFERLRRELPERSRVALTEQHRMTPAIGNLISACFYDGELTSAPSDLPRWLTMALPTPVLWMSTAKLSKRAEQKVGFSRSNPAEARCIRNLLGSLNLVADAAKEKLSVAVLAGYREQCEEVNTQIASSLHKWSALEIDCNTVDAFQGREADVAVYSVTRSNVGGSLGFLSERRRLNVALSRGRSGLVIVGDDNFAYSALGDNPFRTVLDHIAGDPSCSIEEART